MPTPVCAVPPTPVAIGEGASTAKSSGGFFNFLYRTQKSEVAAPQPPKPLTVDAEIEVPPQPRHRALAMGGDTWTALAGVPARVSTTSAAQPAAPASIDAGLDAPAPLWCDLPSAHGRTGPRMIPSIDSFRQTEKSLNIPNFKNILAPPKPISTSPLRTEENNMPAPPERLTALVPEQNSPSDYGLAVPPKDVPQFNHAVADPLMAKEEQSNQDQFQNFVSTLFATDDVEDEYSFNAFELATNKTATRHSGKYTNYFGSTVPTLTYNATPEVESEESWDNIRKVVNMVIQATGLDSDSISHTPSPSTSKASRYTFDPFPGDRQFQGF
ncbi:hypothetical protein AGDE_14261 [Angomonas deanei]|uniref:Uncharacterized protein n=1 Tax=Angomonas deanei TaxID=59799 RepID=A0A7G2C8G8_9TRYP|nr:hypothetical protein AGDE_14261 [Angomonas deanei]CAD2214292.1 hypothetical protein, conserved [Angomonas deanei]|eukprot:EPY21186.1 hypothetical protein AGDE_14261 [Angomonas deanei]